MPSSRDPNKLLIGGFFNKNLKVAVAMEAVRSRSDVSKLLKEFIIDGLLHRGIEVPLEELIDHKGTGPIPKKQQEQLKHLASKVPAEFWQRICV